MRLLGLAFGAAVALAMAFVAPAGADESLQATGSITYTWQGDPSLGCAAIGVCDVQGALTVPPQGAGDAQRHGGVTIISLDGGSATVRVLTGAGANATECIDTPSGNPAGESVFVSGSSSSGLTGSFEPALSSGRCAGPTASDLRRIRLPVRRSAGKHPSYDLSASRTFAAGPYLVTLDSTLVMRPGGGSGSSRTNSGSFTGSFFGGSGGRKVLAEHVTLRYRLTGLPGAMTFPFSGESDPFCAVLDSCGVTGEVALSAQDVSTTLTLSGSRTVKRPRSAREVMADLRRGRIQLGGGTSLGLETSERLARADGSSCQDSVPSSASFTVGTDSFEVRGFPPTRRTAVVLAPAADEVDALRTHCAGPSYGDVFGPGGLLPALARAPVRVAQLVARHSRLTLSDSGGFSGVGYMGSRGGVIGFSLALERIRAGTSEETR